MENCQAQIVGVDSIPAKQIRNRWSFIDAYVGKLKPGQALRLIIPKDTPVTGIISRWKRVGGDRSKSVQTKQPDGSTHLWLWLEER